MGVPKEDEFPLRHSEYQLAPIRKLIFCLKGPSEINTDSRPFLLGHCSGGWAFSRQCHTAWQVINSFMGFFMLGNFQATLQNA